MPFGVEGKDVALAVLNALLTVVLIGFGVFIFQTGVKESLENSKKQYELDQMVAQKVFDFTMTINGASLDMEKALNSNDMDLLQSAYTVEQNAIQQLVMYRDMNLKAFEKYDTQIKDIQEAMNSLIKIIDTAKVSAEGRLSAGEFGACQKRVLNISLALANECSEAIYSAS